MNILGIDSSTEKLNIAVSSQNKLLSSATNSNSKKHMAGIIGCLDTALAEAGMDLSEVDAIAANTGPGDFTGTRIGLSVAKILAWVADKPAYGICSPDIMAIEAFFLNQKDILAGQDGHIISCMDVRRGEVYCSFYRIFKSGSLHNGENHDEKIIYCRDSVGICRTSSMLTGYREAEKEILDSLAKKPGPLYICGNAIKSYGPLFDRLIKSRGKTYYEQRVENPDAFHLNLAAYTKCRRGDTAGNLVPFYVRDFVAFGGKNEQE